MHKFNCHKTNSLYRFAMQNIQRPFHQLQIAPARVFKLLLSSGKISEYACVCTDWNVFQNGNLRTVRDSSKKIQLQARRPARPFLGRKHLPWPPRGRMRGRMWEGCGTLARADRIGRMDPIQPNPLGTLMRIHISYWLPIWLRQWSGPESESPGVSWLWTKLCQVFAY